MAKRGRPALPDEDKRRDFHAFLAPETGRRIAELAGELAISEGRVVDQAVAAYKPRTRPRS